MNIPKELAVKKEGLLLYRAGYPRFKNIFTRDSIISGILMNNKDILKNHLIFSAKHQGKRKNPVTGEEPGKIFHEFPGRRINGLSTRFSACDTTALFLIAHEVYIKITGDKSLLDKQKDNIIMAVKYIQNHLKNNAFIEDPKFCGNKKFALRVTYWKDSMIPLRRGKHPNYPVVYALAHIQNMRALRSASFLLKDMFFKKLASEMVRYFKSNFIDLELSKLYVAIDRKGLFPQVNSDFLHSLFYLGKRDINKKTLQLIEDKSRVLETKAGYRALEKKYSRFVDYKYHAETIWPFEQAIIYAGADKFNLTHVKKVSSRVLDYIRENDSEILKIKNGSFVPAGCNPQLWTIAAKEYFKNRKIAL